MAAVTVEIKNFARETGNSGGKQERANGGAIANVEAKSEAGICVVATEDRLLRFGGLFSCRIDSGGYMV
jgi:hypothetical protein